MFSGKTVSNVNTNLTYDPYFKNTIFLLHADGTNGATNVTYKDNSNYNSTISRGALLNSQGTFSPYSATGWSFYLNGTTDYLTIPSSTSLTFGTGDFTIEFWVYPTGTVTNARQDWIDFNDGVTNNTRLLIYFDGTNIIYFALGSARITASGPTWNAWQHIAVSRSAGTTRLFINGTQSGSSYTDSSNFGALPLYLGKDGGGTTYVAGYMSNVRMVKGVGVYTGNFTSPASDLAITQSSGTNITAISGTSTSLLINLNRWYDATSFDNRITVNGTPWVVPFSPFTVTTTYNPSLHGGSIYHASATDWVGTATATLATATHPQLGLGGEDFTIEFWAYPLTATTATQYFFSNFSADTNNRGMRIGINGNVAAATQGVVVLYNAGATAPAYNTTTVRPLYQNSWSHIAVSRNENVTRVFQNGQMVYEYADIYVYNIPAFTIGNSTYARTTAVVGYTSDLRIVRGSTAYYESNFTPPTAALQPLDPPLSSLYIGQFSGSSSYYSVDLYQFPNVTSSAFCVEFWINFITVPVAATPIFGGANATAGLSIVVASTTTMYLQYVGSYTMNYQTTYNFQAGVWYHIAWMGGNGTNYLAVDGVVYNTNQVGGFGATAATGNGNWLNDFTIGATGISAYYRDIRVTYGTTVYNVAGFSRPTGPLSNVVSGGTVKMLVLNSAGSADVAGQVTTASGSGISGITTTNVTVSANQGGAGVKLYTNTSDTVLLVNGNNGNILDSTGRNVMTYGAAGGATIPSINTSNKKFGTGGVGVMGAGFLRIPNSPLWDFGAGDWIIEFWYYPTSVTVLQTIYSKKAAAAGFGPAQTNLSTTGKLTTLLSTSGTATTQTLTAVASVAINTWNYVTVYRNGANVIQRVVLANSFVDTQTNSTLSTSALAVNTADFVIGNQSNAASQPMLGYVDEFRVTRGTSRGYTTTSFPTLPTEAFPNQ